MYLVETNNVYGIFKSEKIQILFNICIKTRKMTAWAHNMDVLIFRKCKKKREKNLE